MMSNLHPVFRSALASIAPPPAPVEVTRMHTYAVVVSLDGNRMEMNLIAKSSSDAFAKAVEIAGCDDELPESSNLFVFVRALS